MRLDHFSYVTGRHAFARYQQVRHDALRVSTVERRNYRLQDIQSRVARSERLGCLLEAEGVPAGADQRKLAASGAEVDQKLKQGAVKVDGCAGGWPVRRPERIPDAAGRAPGRSGPARLSPAGPLNRRAKFSLRALAIRSGEGYTYRSRLTLPPRGGGGWRGSLKFYNPVSYAGSDEALFGRMPELTALGRRRILAGPSVTGRPAAFTRRHFLQLATPKSHFKRAEPPATVARVRVMRSTVSKAPRTKKSTLPTRNELTAR